MYFKLILPSLFFSFTLSMASSIVVKDQYVRATLPNVKNSVAFMRVINDTQSDVAIIGVKSAISERVELHTHETKNSIMRMYQVKQINLKANSEVIFKTGSFHVMFLELNRILKDGDEVVFTLLLSNGREVKVNAPVKSIKAIMSNKMHGMKH